MPEIAQTPNSKNKSMTTLSLIFGVVCGIIIDVGMFTHISMPEALDVSEITFSLAKIGKAFGGSGMLLGIVVLVAIPIISAIFWGIAGFIAAGFFIRQQKCPHCSEWIKFEAKVCPKCQREIENETVAEIAIVQNEGSKQVINKKNL